MGGSMPLEEVKENVDRLTNKAVADFHKEPKSRILSYILRK